MENPVDAHIFIQPSSSIQYRMFKCQHSENENKKKSARSQKPPNDDKNGIFSSRVASVNFFQSRRLETS